MRLSKPRILAASIVVLVQLLFLPLKVTVLNAADYQHVAVEVAAINRLHFGYLDGGHGATLAAAWSALPGQPPVYPAERSSVRLMRRELLLLPVRWVLELAFYFALLFGTRDLFLAWCRIRPAGHIARSLRATALVTAAFACLAIPLALFGYGASLFSTWEGPGAGSFSGPYLAFSWRFGETVTFRPLLEVIALGVHRLLRLHVLSELLPPMSWAAFFALIVPVCVFPVALSLFLPLALCRTALVALRRHRV